MCFLFGGRATLQKPGRYLEGRAETTKTELKTVPQKMALERRLSLIPLRNATVAKNIQIEVQSVQQRQFLTKMLEKREPFLHQIKRTHLLFHKF